MIHITPSPNFNDRAEKSNIDFLIIHYTGMKTADAALEKMCDSKEEVSTHYMIDENGKIFQLVKENKRAWHAGKSFWQGITDINSHSIGIELVNLGHEFGYHPFPLKQMKSLEKLAKKILARHKIPSYQVLGHSDIAPDRKQDPGELFDWKGFAEKGIGFFPKQAKEKNTVKENLKIFGYNIDVELEILITAFQRHFRQQNVNGIADKETKELLQGCVSFCSYPKGYGKK